MTTTATHTTLHSHSSPDPSRNYLNETRGIWSWLTTLDHKRIGLMYLIGVLGAFALGGMMAVLVRTEHLTPGPTIFTDVLAADGSVIKKGGDGYNRAFTLHGAAMVFLFIIPGIPAALGNFVLPIMLRAKDVAFPRLNLFSWYLYVIGAVFAVITIVSGGIDTGWTFYTPYSIDNTHAVTWIVFGAFILGFSSILTGVNFIATVHMLRPKEMGWFRMPLMVWALYATALIQILATPVLAITLLLLAMERIMGIGIFDPKLGGDPVLFQHFFWFYSHPAVYIMILPAMGIVSELVTTFSRKEVFGYRLIAYSSVAIALLGFLVWGHHLYTSGQSNLAATIFSFITVMIAVPSAIKVFNWLTTMYKGAINLSSPMLYAMAFLWVFSIGGLTGLHLATISLDIHLHDTYFVVSHFHYVMVGGNVFAFLGGLHYWWPKMFGRMYNELMGKICWFLIFLGFNMTFFPQFIMGSQGMPRRYHDYPAEFQFYHVASTIGTYIMAVGFVILLGVLIHAMVAGRRAGRNPWGSATLEWATTSPPPLANFHEDPPVTDPYDYSNLVYDQKTENWEPRRA